MSHPFLRVFILCLLVSVSTQQNVEGASDLISWAKSAGARVSKYEVRHSPGRGWGAFASEDVKKGETLLFVPDGLLLSHRLAATVIQRDLEAAGIVKAGDDGWSDGIGDEQMFAAFLVYESKKGSKSEWNPFIACLPKQLDVPILWTETQLEELQASAAIYRFALQAKNTTRQQHKELMEKLGGLKLEGLNDITLDEYALALANIWSRHFSTPIDDDTLAAFIPVVDVLNMEHSGLINVKNYPEDKGTYIRAETDIARGEEMFLSYGKKPNGRYLLNYGFVQIPPENKMMMVASIPPTERDTRLAELRAELLAEHRVDGDHLFVSPSFLDQLLIVARVYQMSERDFERKVNPKKPLTERKEKATLRTVVQHLQRVSSRYPNHESSAEAKEEAEGDRSRERSDLERTRERLDLARRFLESERQIIEEAIQALEAKREK